MRMRSFAALLGADHSAPPNGGKNSHRLLSNAKSRLPPLGGAE